MDHKKIYVKFREQKWHNSYFDSSHWEGTHLNPQPWPNLTLGPLSLLHSLALSLACTEQFSKNTHTPDI